MEGDNAVAGRETRAVGEADVVTHALDLNAE
jgi:hypothetical protein